MKIVKEIVCRSCGREKRDIALIDFTNDEGRVSQLTGVCVNCADIVLRWHFNLLRYIGTDTPQGNHLEAQFKAGMKPVVAKDAN